MVGLDSGGGSDLEHDYLVAGVDLKVVQLVLWDDFSSSDFDELFSEFKLVGQGYLETEQK